MGHPAVERYTPGHIVCVGTHKVEVVNYLAEGGFAQIYVVKFLEYLNDFANGIVSKQIFARLYEPTIVNETDRS